MIARFMSFYKPGVTVSPEPRDQDPTAQIGAYRFSPTFLLKSPSTFPYLTRSPPLVKSIRSLVQKLAPSPLSSIEIEPAVHPWLFHMLAPGSFQLLRFNPWFLQKTPKNLVFLTEKPLNLVFSLDYAF